MFCTASIFTALIIFLARASDVTLGTLRHVMIVRSRKTQAFAIAFFEALIWVFAVSRVLSQIQSPYTAIAFALGFATGTYAGLTLEGFIKIGEQVVRVFTRDGDAIAEALRQEGYRVTLFDGKGRDGHVNLLFVQVRRRSAHEIAAIARGVDPTSFILFDDIRAVHPV